MRFLFSIYLLLPLLVIGAVSQYEGTLATSKLSGAVSMAPGAEIAPVKKPLQWYYGDLLHAAEPAGEGDSFAATGSRAIYCMENGGTPPYDKKHACAICSIDTFECPLPETRILGAIDRDDHTPVTELQEDAYGSCVTTNTNVYIGFDHSRANTSNLVLIARHAEEQYQKTHHCFGLIWEKGGSIDLRGLLQLMPSLI